MVILGAGLGGVMQVLVIIVQNAVPHSELGVATSGATFFRSIGGSFGTAIFGAIFANVLVGNLVSHLHGLSLPPGFHTEDITPETLAHLPELVHQRAGVRLCPNHPDRVRGVRADLRPGLPGQLPDPPRRAAEVAGSG